MSIERNVNGVVDFCLSKVEEIENSADLDVEKKTRYGLAYLKEVRGFVRLNIDLKNLMIRSPEIARNNEIVLQIGSQDEAKPA